MQGAPIMVMNTNAKRETGRKAQTSNIQAAKAVADIIRTTLGPRSMLKMILDPMGGIVMTNDGSEHNHTRAHTHQRSARLLRCAVLCFLPLPLRDPPSLNLMSTIYQFCFCKTYIEDKPNIPK